MEYIYALDLSLSSTGVAIFNQDGKIKKLLTIETDSKSETQIRLKKIGSEFLKIKKEYNPKVIVIESGFTRFNVSTQMLFRVHGLAQYIFSEIEQVYYYPMTIRKVVCGKGNVKKEQMRDFIIKKYGNIKFKNFDESDAFGIGLCWFMDKGILK
jgi:Holliday junction resolvasome RuvABC endonuclease subunit